MGLVVALQAQVNSSVAAQKRYFSLLCIGRDFIIIIILLMHDSAHRINCGCDACS